MMTMGYSFLDSFFTFIYFGFFFSLFRVAFLISTYRYCLGHAIIQTWKDQGIRPDRQRGSSTISVSLSLSFYTQYDQYILAQWPPFNLLCLLLMSF